MSGVEKSIYRIISVMVTLALIALVYFILRGSNPTLPDLSNHDFEWFVLALLLFIAMDGGYKCK